ncbi:MAG: Ribonuclease HII [Methanocella sp. PtaU1.Bin125]|nr:MAG: Ribonuclease HII [Methanocella sp. PtaU1.Bin125]
MGRAKAKARAQKVMGVDEAGRGPVIGPLVVCGAHIDQRDLPDIEALGLKDSKKLTAKKRESFATELKGLLKYELVVLTPGAIDARVGSEENLNALEVNCFAETIRKAMPAVAYVDACDVNAERFGHNIRQALDFDLEIVSCHEADDKYPIVMAASILAKVRRDALIREISEQLGEDVGSGYPNDPVTVEFLKGYYRKNKKLPDCCRRSWKTCNAIIADCLQARLFQYE